MRVFVAATAGGHEMDTGRLIVADNEQDAREQYSGKEGMEAFDATGDVLFIELDADVVEPVERYEEVVRVTLVANSPIIKASKREPTKHVVERKDGELWIEGKLLIHRYEEGDIDTPSTWYMLWAALYDLHQTNDIFEDEDTIEFAGMVFARVESVHVVPVMNQYFNSEREMRYVRLP